MEDGSPPDDQPPVEPPPTSTRDKKFKDGNKFGRIDQDIYEEMARTYIGLKSRTIRALSRATGINMKSCRRAVVLGWPERGWPSLAERAQIHDKRTERQAEQEASKPLSPGQLLDAKRFQEIRNENLNLARAIRGMGAMLLERCRQAVERATADRVGQRTRVINVEVGEGKNKRTVQRVVKEDVIEPPYLPHLTSAVANVSEMMLRAGEAERSWSRAPTPEELVAESVGWTNLTEAQLEFVIKNNGKLPADVTPEMLWGRAAAT